MHETKKYEHDRHGDCCTQCDHIPHVNADGRKIPLYVGSRRCRLKCPHFVCSGPSPDSIVCSYGGDMADKAMDALDDAAAGAQGHDV